MQPEPKISEVLEKVIQLLQHPDNWTKNTSARLPHGRPTSISDPKACRFCIAGAIGRVTYPYRDLEYEVRRFVGAQLGGGIIHYNDSHLTEHAHIMALLQKSLNAALKQERNAQ